MKINNLSATGYPDFVYTASSTMERLGDRSFASLTIAEAEPLVKTWLWQLINPGVQAPEKPKTEQLLTRQDMCNVLRISLPTLDKYCNNGTINYRKLGRRVLFTPQEVDRIMGLMATNQFKR